ncbi:MAG: DUF1349 domain-containing protein, partial [Anaerolineales bacterium]|nr:DUF1349 domain-containing protein [Anaerolineales bacterium]
WLNENPVNWSLSEFPGFLRINVVGGYLYLRNASNVLLTPAPADNYFIETSLSFSPRRDNQFAGLIMYETDDNYIQAGLSYCNPINDCVGRGLYIDIYQNGNLVPPRNTVQFTEDGLAMRMLRNGNKITFYTSEDGTVWYRLRDFTTTIDVKWVGLITGQSLDRNPAPALFDYFQISILK